ncbi:hypothetical protein [Wolbachia endosymbiont (group A) of Agelastica alni]
MSVVNSRFMAVHFTRQGLWLGLAENVILATSPCNLIGFIEQLVNRVDR